MSEIQRYMYARDGMVPDAEHLRGSGEPEFWVRFTDHEAAIEELQQMRRTLHSNLEYKDARIAELEADREQVLADAKARIGRLAAPNGSYGEAEWGFLRGVTAALAALTQPQTERCPEDCDGFGRLIGDSDGPCPACSGLEPDRGGAAVAADLDPREAFVAGFMFSGEGFNGECHNMSTIEATLDRRYEELVKPEEPGPYAKAFREKFPVPEFPGIKNRQEDQA